MTRRKLPDPTQVATGRARASLEQLFLLIDEVNPTDERLSEATREARYALKSSLQSLLLRQHREALVIEPHPSDPRVVTLRHRLSGRDACHARVDKLDADVRALVEASAAPPATPSARRARRAPEAPLHPLDRGLRALDDYDFVAAEAALLEAGDTVAARRALLALWVEILADDARALEVALGPETGQDPEVRGLVALAATRAGDPRAADWLRGARGPAAAEAAARQARLTPPEALPAAIARLAELDPNHAALGELREALERQRAQDREAQRVREAQAREARVAALSAQLDAALAEGDGDRGAALCRALRALGEERGAEEARARALQEDAIARAVEADIAGGRLAEALRGSADLSPAHRERLAAAHPPIGWFAALPESIGRVDAVLALWRGEDPEPHARILRLLPEGRTLLEARERARQDAERSLIESFEAALADGDPEEAARRLPELPPGRREAAREALAQRERALALEAELRDATRAEDWLRARGLCEALGRDAEAMDERLRAAWRLRVHAVDIGTDQLEVMVESLHPRPWLSEDGRLLVVPQMLGCWVYVRVLDAESLALLRVIELRLPAPMWLSYAVVERGTVTLIGPMAELLELRLSDARILRYLPSPLPEVSGDYQTEGAILAPGGRFVWAEWSDTRGQHLRVFDTSRWPEALALEELGYPVPVLGLPEALVFTKSVDGGGQLHAPGGGARGGPCSFIRGQALRVCAHPNSATMCALQPGEPGRAVPDGVRQGALRRYVAAAPMEISWKRPGNFGRAYVALPLSDAKGPIGMAASLDEGVLILKHLFGSAPQLTTTRLGDSGGQFSLQQSGRVPVMTLLCTDARSRKVRTVAKLFDGLHAVSRTDSAENQALLAIERDGRSIGYPLSFLRHLTACKAPLLTERAEIVAVGALPRAQQLPALWALEVQHAQDAEAAMDVFDAFLALGLPNGRSERARALLERFPANPRALVELASAEISDNRLARALELMRQVPIDSLEPAVAEHALHVLALCLVHCGDAEGAALALTRARACGVNRCDLRPLEQHLSALGALEVAGEEGVADLTLYFGPLVRFIRDADEALARGEPRAVLEATEEATIWIGGERQSASRLAEAHLALAPADARSALRRRLSLAHFVWAHLAWRSMGIAELPVPGHIRSDEELEALAERVRAELDGELPVLGG